MNSCNNSNQYTVVDSFVDIGAGPVLSMWFVLAMHIVFNIGNKRFILEANDAMYNELFTRVKRWLTNRINGKAAEHS